MRVRWVLAALAALASPIFGEAARADSVYDTTPSWDGSSAVIGWGAVQAGDTPTFGQTFLAPADPSALTDFTFFVSDFNPGSSVTFTASIYSWYGALTAGNGPQGSLGPALFTSSPITFLDDGGFQAVTITTGPDGVSLDPSGSYVALLTTSDPSSIASNDASLDVYEFGLVGPGHAPGGGDGGFNFFNNATSAQLDGDPWDSPTDYGDLAWTAHFRSVPEPGSLTLLALGAAGALARARRRPR